MPHEFLALLCHIDDMTTLVVNLSDCHTYIHKQYTYEIDTNEAKQVRGVASLCHGQQKRGDIKQSKENEESYLNKLNNPRICEGLLIQNEQEYRIRHK